MPGFPVKWLQQNLSEVHTVQAGRPDNVPLCHSVKKDTQMCSAEILCHLFMCWMRGKHNMKSFYQYVLLYSEVIHGLVFLDNLLQVDLRAAHQHPDQCVLTCAISLWEWSRGSITEQVDSMQITSFCRYSACCVYFSVLIQYLYDAVM